MDPLSDVLRSVRLTGGIVFSARLSAPWAFRSPPPDVLAPALGIRADCIALFHILIEGHCWLQMGDAPALSIDDGTAIVLPHGDAHVLASRPGLEPRPLDLLLRQCGEDDPLPRVSHGRGGPVSRFLCGYFVCDQRFNPLVGALPVLIAACPRRGLFVTEPATSALEPTLGPAEAPFTETVEEGGRRDARLEMALRYTIEEVEAERAGAPALLSRLTEILYLELIREYARRLPAGRTGWLAGVEDPEVGRALRLMHAEPQRKWTVAELARGVNLSRSALGQRFTEVMGAPPMHYLAGWRVQLSKDLLRQPALSVAQVASRVGYESEVAFHRAFKRHVGQTPAAWRLESRRMPGRVGRA